MTLTDSIAEFLPSHVRNPAPPAPADPFKELDNLMCVVEALCPVCPSKPIDVPRGHYVL
jgi:hypothetical protein